MGFKQRKKNKSFKKGNNSNQGKSQTKTSRKTLQDYQYYLGSSKQAADYQQTTEFLINHIRKTYEYGNDIATALEESTPFQISSLEPVLSVSSQTDTDAKDAENRMYEMKFKIEYDLFLKRKQCYINNLTKAYAFLWEQCNKAMQNKIEARKDYMSIKNDPIQLLSAIKQQALNYQDTKYPPAIILDSIKAVLNMHQKEGESLQDYTRRFKTARDIMNSHTGSVILLPKLSYTLKDYKQGDKAAEEKCLKQAFNMFLTYTYLENSDKAKYGTLLTGLASQHSLGHNQYPTSLTGAMNALSKHRHDNYKKQKEKERTPQKDTNRADEPA